MRPRLSYLLPANILFICLLLILAFYNRFAVDDFFTLGLIKESGVKGAINYFYHFANGRWAAVSLMVSSIYAIHEKIITLVIYELITIAALIAAVYFFLKRINTLFNLSLAGREIFSYCLSFILLYFLVTPKKGECWFWLTATSQYLWCITLMLAGIVVILNNMKGILPYLFIALAFIFIGGSPESFIAGTLFLFFILFFAEKFLAFLSGKIDFKLLRRHVSIATAFLLCSFAINFFSPGSKERSTRLPEPDILKALFENSKGLIKFGLFEIPSLAFYVIIFCIPWFLLGNAYYRPQNTSLKTFRKKFLVCCCMLAGIFFIMLLPGTYVLSEPPPKRAWMQVYFILTCFLCYWSFRGGKKFFVNELKLKRLKLFYIVSSIVFFSVVIIYQFKTVKNYSEAYDARMNLINNVRDTITSTLIVGPLPSSGMLYSAEVSPDSAHYESYHVQYGTGLKVPIKLKE